jgi:tRNA(Arg) A34 adenosine deaminase TadA
MSYAEIRLVLPAWIDDEVDRSRHYVDDVSRVGLAIRLARRNIEERTGGPFGAAIFDDGGTLVAAAVNIVLPQNCSAAHAEVMAFAAAQAQLKRARLNEDGKHYTLATSAQPCTMCYGASIWAGIDEILIGARAEDVMQLSAFDEGPLPSDWIGELGKRRITVRRDILRDEAREVFELYSRTDGRKY